MGNEKNVNESDIHYGTRSKTDDHSATRKINHFVEKFAWWIVGIVVTMLTMVYNNTTDRIGNTEEKVAFLYQDKISRAEFREVTKELQIQAARDKKDILDQQKSMKSDILSRLDLILRVQSHKEQQ